MKSSTFNLTQSEITKYSNGEAVTRGARGVLTPPNPAPSPPSTAGVPFLMTAELFTQSHRPAAYVLGGSLNWLCNFTIGFIFPFLQVLARGGLWDGTGTPRTSQHPPARPIPAVSLSPDVSWSLLLPGFLRRLPAGGPLRPPRRPRDQEQNLRGDQPHLRRPPRRPPGLPGGHAEAPWLWGLGGQPGGIRVGIRIRIGIRIGIRIRIGIGIGIRIGIRIGIGIGIRIGIRIGIVLWPCLTSPHSGVQQSPMVHPKSGDTGHTRGQALVRSGAQCLLPAPPPSS